METKGFLGALGRIVDAPICDHDNSAIEPPEGRGC